MCVYGSVWFCGFQEDELLAQTVSLWDRKDTNEGKISEKTSSVHTVCDEERKQRALVCCRRLNEGFLFELRMWYLIIFKHTDICIQTPPHTPTPFHICPHLPATRSTSVWCNSVLCFSLSVKAGIHSRLNSKFEIIQSLAAKVVHKDLVKLVWEPLPGVVHTSTSSAWRVKAGDTFDSTESHFQPEN